MTSPVTLCDPAVLDAYEADLAVELVGMFSEDAPRLAEGVRSARDREARVRAAHTLRGCALNLGASELARTCAAIESFTRNGDDVAGLIATLDALVASTVRALRAHCSGTQCAPL